MGVLDGPGEAHLSTDRRGPRRPQGHRLEDQMVALLGDSLTPLGVLARTAWYIYNQLVDTT